MKRSARECPDCALDRRDFLHAAGAGVAAVSLGLTPALSAAEKAAAAEKAPETLVKALYNSLNEKQRGAICFDWDHTDPRRGLLRTRVANNWHITRPAINSDFFTADQRGLVREIFEGLFQDEWLPKVDKQLKDDTGGFGNQQNIALFGTPGSDKFEFVLTGRHMTVRCDGNTTEHVAFGGPIFYGHAAEGFVEDADHPGNVYWEQALAANKVYQMLDGKQQREAEVANTPAENKVSFQGADGKFPGIRLSDLSSDQMEEMERVLAKLLEPYRNADRQEVRACLQSQGGLEACSLAFFTDEDVGRDKVWDNWRLEGPSFVWHFRGSPHVHVWVNIADSPNVKLNAGA